MRYGGTAFRKGRAVSINDCVLVRILTSPDRFRDGGTRRDTAKSLGTGSEGGRQCSIIDIRERDLPLGGRSGSCQIGFYEPDGRSSVMAEGTPAPSRSPVRARQIRIPAALPNYRELLRKLILTTTAREI